jgi:magnesium chelatase family protein
VRPFRSPHHTVSAVALSGGGSIPKPGEVSLAHNGVLFLDELPEFSRTAIEGLRQPIEDGQVSIARVAGTLTYPCNIMLIAAMNPCPCGYFGHPSRQCSCPDGAAARYVNKISGPLLDRLDIHVEVPPVNYDQLSSKAKGESSETIRKRVNEARNFQLERYQNAGILANASLTAPMLQKFCPMDDQAKETLRRVFDKLGLSARGYDRILKVARTIADLDKSEVIRTPHIAEAIQYRTLDRKYWQSK